SGADEERLLAHNFQPLAAYDRLICTVLVIAPAMAALHHEHLLEVIAGEKQIRLCCRAQIGSLKTCCFEPAKI
ncbi:hypothetical protein PMAYCL1PPCAC_19888, partial [Pristionchus mayeri]